jgi:3-(3-hydroxy-phenyl)propionate hydroxylase
MIGSTKPWDLDWATVYSASAITLPEFVHGRIALVGDAAHLLPIFGVRGCNTGIQDAHNLAWKLAFRVRGWSGEELLASYSSECVAAAREICDEAGKSTRFMTPPSKGFRLMRDAVLSLSLSEDFVKDLLHWRTSRPHEYHASPLNSPADEREFTGGIACGQAARNVRLGADDYLFDRLGTRCGFLVMAFAGADGLTRDLEEILAAVGRLPYPVIRAVVETGNPDGIRGIGAELTLSDEAGHIARKYAAEPGTVYVLRPDRHVCARWRRADAGRVCAALRRAADPPRA